jgi:RecJ-like exonuclease
MIARQIADAVGVSTFFGLTVVMLGCIPMGTGAGNLEPFVAVTGNYAIHESSSSPTPAPAPDSDVCESCNGTGKSDGRVTCPTCNGTGKKTKVATVLVHPVAPTICRTGTCSTQRTVR